MTLFKIKVVDDYIALVQLAIILSVITVGAGDPEGFIGIDCGRTGRSYNDSQTNLTWKGDEPYTRTGSNGEIPQSLWNTLDSSLENYQALKTFRYFPLSRQKYCYELPLKRSNAMFLIRAIFLHGNSSHLHGSTKFQVYMNNTRWIQVQYGMNDLYDFNYTKPEVREGLYYNENGNRIFVCLIPEKNIPFISSLELRETDSIWYTEALTNGWLGRDILLSTLGRWQFGTDGTVRYPYDLYDRLWSSIPDAYDGDRSRTFPVNASKDTLKKFNDLPIEVAKVGSDLSRCESGSCDFDLPFLFYPSVNRFACSILYFEAEQSSVESNLTLEISYPDGSDQAMEAIDLKTFMKYAFYEITMENQYGFDIEFSSSGTGKVQVLAGEVYQSDKWDTLLTNEIQAAFVAAIKEAFNLSDWQGDPCVPKPYDWITCSQVLENMVFPDMQLNSIVLSHQNYREFKNIPPEHNYFAGIRFWSITHGNLDDDTLFQLLTTSLNDLPVSIRNLNLSHNTITSLLFDKTRWEDWQKGTWDAPFAYVRWIDLSHNHLDEAFLHVDFHAFLISNLQSYSGLQALDVSNNNMTGEIPRDFWSYFVDSTNFEKLYVDNSDIKGTLNFTIWFEKARASLQHSVRFNDSETIFHQLYSFTSNDILDITPSVRELESNINVTLLIEQFNKFEGGLLLGGNPFCNDAKTLLHRYLCRSSVNDMSYALRKEEASKLLIIIVGVLGGIFALILGSIALAIILRLRRQVATLRQFQDELLSRKVQPPFFSYHDLKIATKDFHDDNMLGSGAFGAVYKGVLQDKREVAVKKLYNRDKQVQVLNDFLNEVVLLTGIKHRNLVQLLGCCVNNKERILIYEYAEKGNVADALWGRNAQLQETPLGWEERLNICVGVAWGLSFLHKELQPGIIHRDIKAANILIDKNLNPKIADFGLAKLFREEESHAQFTFFAGTKGYLAPEYILDGILTDKADVYSYGILALEIVSGRTSVDPTQPEDKVSLKYWAETLQEQGKTLEILPLGLGENWPSEDVLKVINIALLCLDREPRLRPTMTQVAIMLAGTADDTMFLSLSNKRRSSDKMAFDLEGEDGHQTDSMPLIPWTGESSTILHESTDPTEEDALVDSREMESSFDSSPFDVQSNFKRKLPTFKERVVTASRSFSRNLSLP